MIISWSNGIGVSEWNCWSSGLHPEVISVGRCCCPLNVFDCRAVSLGRVSRSGLLPYPRYMSSSLAPEWFWVRVGMELKVVPPQLSCFGSTLLGLVNHAKTLTSFSVALSHSEVVE